MEFCCSLFVPLLFEEFYLKDYRDASYASDDRDRTDVEKEISSGSKNS